MSVDEILRVPYNLPGSQQWQWMSIYTRMSQERIIFLNQPVTMGLANSLVSALLYLDSEEQNKPVYIYINSLGDPVLAGMTDESVGAMSIMAGLAIYDTMQHIKSEIITVCLGQAIGVAAMLLSSGTKGKRGCLPHSMIALNHTLSGTQGQATDIDLNAREVLAKQALMVEILAQNTGQTPEKIAKDMNRTFYLTPEQAKDYGIIDQILPSRKALSESVSGH
ncbi:MAG: ATP-dependent Clp protease proteolytic subunit [Oscillatoriales cyanobacterium RM1_1_9]|nr:ATP-dependent Clp protease proteolytic subunit [Oscillatoriales cyanobacterium SM2_3_0]NJO47091.1 ATP-dependent Clp protease proteolytic subunit [Oscillatoriales cyanobacterium RM2_1_1]NJO71883.1 ATP-dependent Clp protease proteolytic subunit [Oscillatoriales cyanobacterium RM1_1_9]